MPCAPSDWVRSARAQSGLLNRERERGGRVGHAQIAGYERLKAVAGDGGGDYLDGVKGPEVVAGGERANAFEEFERDVDEFDPRQDRARSSDGCVAEVVGGTQKLGVGECAREADAVRSGSEVGAQAVALRLQGDELREGGGVEVEHQCSSSRCAASSRDSGAAPVTGGTSVGGRVVRSADLASHHQRDPGVARCGDEPRYHHPADADLGRVASPHAFEVHAGVLAQFEHAKR